MTFLTTISVEQGSATGRDWRRSERFGGLNLKQYLILVSEKESQAIISEPNSTKFGYKFVFYRGLTNQILLLEC